MAFGATGELRDWSVHASPPDTVTVLSPFKPFRGDRALRRQQNTADSWRALGVNVEVVAFDRTPGLWAIAAEHGLRLVLDVPARRLPGHGVSGKPS